MFHTQVWTLVAVLVASRVSVLCVGGSSPASITVLETGEQYLTKRYTKKAIHIKRKRKQEAVTYTL